MLSAETLRCLLVERIKRESTLGCPSLAIIGQNACFKKTDGKLRNYYSKRQGFPFLILFQLLKEFFNCFFSIASARCKREYHDMITLSLCFTDLLEPLSFKLSVSENNVTRDKFFKTNFPLEKY